MYSIRLHGRGGQGMKTAGRVLGTAFFREGFEVQDAPRYGAERRGAPIFAYVRASREPINERGIIRRPDLIVVADDTLVPVAAAGVLAGIRPETVLLFNSQEQPDVWKTRLSLANRLLMLPSPEAVAEPSESVFVGSICAGAAARLTGVISRNALAQAIREELTQLGEDIVAKNLQKAVEAYDLLQEHAGCVAEGIEISPDNYEKPAWIDLPFEDAGVSAPVIHAGLTSVEVKTGLWRSFRPVVDYERCHRCGWICGSFCPDSAIRINEQGFPQIDYDHCKGCMICMAQCPSHAIAAISERKAQQQEGMEGRS